MILELRARLNRELDHLIDELTVNIPARLGTDQQYGDYQDTVVLQRVIQGRIQQLRRLIAGLAHARPEALPPDAAGFGSVLRVKDLGSGEGLEYTLMEGDGIDLEAGEISLDSPVGRALVGRRPGDEVEVATPQGRRRLRVLSLATLAERVGAAEIADPSPRQS